jgi:M6 family metalloprotease-like protein
MIWLARLPLPLPVALPTNRGKIMKKNIIIFATFLSFVLASCDALLISIPGSSTLPSETPSSITTTSIEASSSIESTSSQGSSSSETTSSSNTTTSQEVSSSSANSSASQTSTTSESSSSSSESSSASSQTIINTSPLVQDVSNFWSIPSVGTPKVLVVPVQFPTSTFANATTAKNNINTAVNGAPSGSFQSLNSFYKTSSFNKLDLQGTVLDVFTTQFQPGYYENLTAQDPNTVIINEIMNFYNSSINFNDYDYDGDGNLDGIYMIYNYPAGNWASFWWAYLSSYLGNSTFDGVRPTSYIWMPYSFVSVNNSIDSETFIHETGHMLGLEDYYDYAPNDGSGNEYGLGGADMMDSNLGDHNPWSKMILGWIDPIIIERTTTNLEVLPYISTGQALIITDKWNNTYFDEFIVAMYYTPTGFYGTLDPQGYFFDKQPGMVLYHVDARLGPSAKTNSAYPFSPYINNNTDTPNKLIKYIEADGNNSLMNGFGSNPPGFVWAQDVYRPGNIFRGNRNLGYAWHQSSLGAIDFTIHFVSEVNNVKIVLNINY